jgi:Fur family peroxide stress response transcriptional regulator
MHGHPTPEEVYLLVKERIPAISLATVYKNIHVFIHSGLFREVSLHHGTLRVETNHRPHHHLLCSECKSISDIEAADLGLLPPRTTLPSGFLVERFSVDVIGICAKCQTTQTVN